MCPPAAAALPALAIGSSSLATAQMGIAGLSAIAGVASAIKQSSDTNKQAAETETEALKSFFFETERLGVQDMQSDDQVTQKLEDNRKKRMRSVGSVIAASAAGNVQGVSVDRLVGDYFRSEGVIGDRLALQQEQGSDQRQAQAKGSQSKAKDRINSAPRSDGTEVFGAAINGAAGLFSTYANVRKDLLDTSKSGASKQWADQ